MDDTQIEALLQGLEAAEPADAPELADKVAALLEAELEGEATAGERS